MLIVSRNLRTELPTYDTPGFAAQWAEAMQTLIRVDAMDVPCCMSLGTRRILFQVARAMKAKSILDIGTYVGLSALNYALAVGEGGRVVTVDNRSANNAEAFWKTTGRPMSPRRLLEYAGVIQRVEFVTEDSVDYLYSEPRCFDIISIDGLHESYQVYTELSLAMHHLNPGGLIFLDDVMQFDDPGRPKELDYIDGPYNALQRHLAEDAPLNVVYNSHSMEGEWTATAFVLRRA